MEECIFCSVLAGRLPGSFVYRDELCAVILDIHPISPGHLLVIPVAHASSLAELEPDTGMKMFKLAQRLAGALRSSGLRCEGVNFALADGAAAGQEVFHVHLHVFPRFAGDGFALRFPPGYPSSPPRAELDRACGRIRAALPDSYIP